MHVAIYINRKGFIYLFFKGQVEISKRKCLGFNSWLIKYYKGFSKKPKNKIK